MADLGFTACFCDPFAAALPLLRHVAAPLGTELDGTTKQGYAIMGLILLILIILFLFGGGGYYGYRSGYYGGAHYGGGLGLVVLIIILFLLFGGGGYWGHY
jgi:hypothetical protein